ncbi:MAG: efflux RND transporter periplasmic adaptor subunit [Rhodobacteraceae bacterium]|nr:efflux RND transporter periplasmic adaptor subunit [Paracoccaceae bacterium]
MRLIAIAALAGLILPAMAPAQEGAKAPVVGVEVITPSVIADSEQFNGRVEAEDKVELRARSAGFVQSVNFSEGGHVEKGDILFEIEPDAYKAAITQIEGQIQSAQAEETLAQIEVDRQRELFRRDTVAENQVQQAEAALGNAQGVITQLQGALQQARLNLSYTQITAPFSGRVGFTNVDVGAFVGPESGGLVTISSVDPIYVSFPVAEARVLDLQKRGQGTNATAELTLANGDTYEQKGVIIAADATVNRGTDTLLVRAEFPNPDQILLDGQLVRIRLTAVENDPVLSFPLQALQRDQGGYFVMLVNSDSKVEKRVITVDRFSGTRVVPKDGLAKGDQVIVQGLQRVQPGMTVKATPISAKGAATQSPAGGTTESDG